MQIMRMIVILLFWLPSDLDIDILQIMNDEV